MSLSGNLALTWSQPHTQELCLFHLLIYACQLKHVSTILPSRRRNFTLIGLSIRMLHDKKGKREGISNFELKM